MSDPINYTPSIAPTELAPIVHIATTSNGRQVFSSSVGGYRRALIHEPRCNVCKCPVDGVLDDIHRMAANGVPPNRISKMIPEDVKLSTRQIRHHLVNHFGEYALFERALASVSFAFGEGDTPSRVSGMHASQIIMERGTALLAQGRVEIKAGDILAAARFQHDMEQEEQGIADATVYSEAMMIVLGKFYESVGPARFNAVMWSLASDPRMAVIMRDTGLNPAAAIQQEIRESPVMQLISTM